MISTKKSVVCMVTPGLQSAVYCPQIGVYIDSFAPPMSPGCMEC